MTAPELKPCPFCGGDAEEANYLTEGAVRCVSCYAKIVRRHGPHEDNGVRDSIALWNTRTTTLADALALPEIAALVEACRAWGMHIEPDEITAADPFREIRAALAALTTAATEVSDLSGGKT